MEKQLPKNWVETELENLFNLVYGKGLSVSELTDDGYDVYGANGIIGKYKEYTYENSKVLISCRGAASGAIHKTKPNSYITSNSIVLNEISSDLINLDFVKHVMINTNKEAVITGTAQPQITIQLLKDLKIVLPPLAEQNRMVVKLDSLFARLETIKISMANVPLLLKDFRQQVLTQAVTGKLTEEWRKGKGFEDIETLYNKITSFLLLSKKWKRVELNSEKYSNIPSTWKKTFIGNISEVSNGSTPSRKINEYWNGFIPWIGSGFIQNNRISYCDEYITDEGFKNSSVKLLPKGSVLIAMIGEGKTRAQSAILDIEGTINQNIAAIIIEHNLIIPEFLQYYLISNYEKHREVGSGTGPQALNCQKVRELEFVLPPLEEQQEIVSRVESLFAKADAIEMQYEALKAKIDNLPQAILHKAFKGELTEQLESDGDARELLKEIEALKLNVGKAVKGKSVKVAAKKNKGVSEKKIKEFK